MTHTLYGLRHIPPIFDAHHVANMYCGVKNGSMSHTFYLPERTWSESDMRTDLKQMKNTEPYCTSSWALTTHL